MKIENIKKDYVLSAVDIDKMSTEIKQFLQLLNIEKRNILRIHLSLEHALLKWQEHFGAECACTLEAGVRLGRPYLSLSVQGDVLNPFDETEDELENLGNRLLTEMGLSPEFSYQKEKNKVQLRLKKQKKNPVRQVLYAIVLAVVVGVAGKLLPEQVITYINEVILTSIFNSFLGLLCTIAGPMIFISVICGIYSIGDMTTFGKIGKSMFSQFTLVLLAVTTIVLALALPFFNVALRSGSISGENEAGSNLLQMVLDILPGNIVEPFLSGNSLQIMVIGLGVGIGMLVLGNRAKEIAKGTEQLNLIIQFLMEQIGKLLPLFIFIIIAQRILTDSIQDILNSWKLAVSIICLGLLTIAAVLLFVAIRLKVSVKILLKKMLPAYLIALTTVSSSAAFSTNLMCLEKRMGISEKITKFGLPLGTVVFMPMSCVTMVCVILYTAETASVEISFPWLLMAILVIVVISIALPPIPGGALTCYTILFSQLGLPQESLAIILTMDVLLDCFITAGNVASIQLQLLLLSDRMQLLNKECLRTDDNL